MSMYYGIGPEFFYEKELTDDVKQMIVMTAQKEKIVISQSNGHKNKQDDFHEMFDTVSFDRVMRDYMLSMKMLLAKADDADLDKLRTALTINQKMGRRLEAIVHVREEEERIGSPSLTDLLSQVSE